AWISSHAPPRNAPALLPAEQAGVELKGRCLIAGCELVPVAMAGLRRSEGRARALHRAPHDVEHDTLWGGNHREAADAGDIGRWHVLCAALPLDLGRGRIHVVDPYIAEPARAHARTIGRGLDVREAGAAQARACEEPVV